MSKQSERSSDWFEMFVWGLVVAALSVAAMSFIESALMRYHGGKWEEVAHVADFWGGHLNSLALAALALGLLYQKRQLDSQRQELEKTQESLTKQLQAIENDTAQQGVHFLLNQLQEMSQNIEGVAVFQMADGQTERQRVKGVRDLAYYLIRQEMEPDQISVTIWPKELGDYRALAEATLKETQRMLPDSQDVVKKVCDILCPEPLVQYQQRLMAEIEKWSTKPVSEVCQRTVRQLLERGYKLQVPPFAGGFVAVAINELETHPPRLTSGESPWLTEAEALQALCESNGRLL